MLAVERGEAQAHTQIGQVGVRIVPAVEFGDRLGIAVAGFRLDQRALPEMRLEQPCSATKNAAPLWQCQLV